MTENENLKKEISVSSYLDFLNNVIRGFNCRIIGEVTSLQIFENKGYLFFSIKDKNDNSVLGCIMWMSQYNMSGVTLKEGLEIIISGHSDIYKPSGRLTFHAETVELVGEGSLKIAYEKLKSKLEEEGLFETSRKKEIPQFPKNIGLITSNNGAAKGDFLSNLRKSGFNIYMIDSRVEGQLAVNELYRSIKTFAKINIDVLVIIRGGGSLESLLPFNNETLVREIINFPHPVIVGVGHDRDISLLGLVADKEVSTPTAAATILNESWGNALFKVEACKQKIFELFKEAILNKNYFINNSYLTMRNGLELIFEKFKLSEQALGKWFNSVRIRMQEVNRVVDRHQSFFRSNFNDELKIVNKKISTRLTTVFLKMDYLLNKIKLRVNLDNQIKSIINEIKQKQQKIISLNTILDINNPDRQLKLGYSILRSNGVIVKNIKNINVGDFLDITVSDGGFKSEVKNIN